MAYSDADLARDLHDRRSVTSTIHTINVIYVSWKCKKQVETALHSNGAELRAIQTGVKETIVCRHLMQSMGFIQHGPTLTFEDNQATIQQVIKDHLTPQVRHLDVLITWLHGHYNNKVFKLSYEDTLNMKAAFNRKPTCGDKLFNFIHDICGFIYIPPKNSSHYQDLELNKYNIFLINKSQVISNLSSNTPQN